MRLSVIVCTHNPRADYLSRVLDGLKAQTLPKDQWELLVIDNASEKPVSSIIDLKWHPKASLVVEPTLGLTPARLRGITESSAELLVFVDDDNILAASYLQEALEISKRFEVLGAWNGQMHPEFESDPPAWSKNYLNLLALRKLDSDLWSNLLEPPLTIPCGAGMCVRRAVATEYLQRTNGDVRRQAMDRKGKLLTGSGDTDLAFTAHDLGFGTGVFKALELIHLIPSFRLTEDYLLRLAEGTRYSETILAGLRGYRPANTQGTWLRRFMGSISRRLLLSPRERRFTEARTSGYRKACAEINNWKNQRT